MIESFLLIKLSEFFFTKMKNLLFFNEKFRLLLKIPFEKSKKKNIKKIKLLVK